MSLDEVVMKACEIISQIRQKESALMERNISTLSTVKDTSQVHSRGVSSTSSVMY